MEALAAVKIDYDVLKGDNYILQKQLDECYDRTSCDEPSSGGTIFALGLVAGLVVGFVGANANR